MKFVKIITIVALMLNVAMANNDVANAKDNETINVNFRNLKIKDFIEMISKITQKNILIEDKVKGMVNFVATKPIKKSSLMELANSILASKKLTLVNFGEYYKVVKISKAASQGLEVYDKIKSDTMQTVMFTLHSASANTMKGKIKPLLGKNAKIVAFKENNVLAITANPRVLASVAKVIDTIEQRGQKTTYIYKLKDASAKDVYLNAKKMAIKIFPKGVPSESVDIYKDEATNSLILVGNTQNIERMKYFIKSMDVKGEDLDQKMHVITLENSDVKEMEKIIGKLMAQMNSIARKRGRGKRATKALVVADESRNALIVLATGEQYRNILETIKRIDVPKAQVYVKARIVEINTNLAEELGIRYGFEGGKITSKGLFSAAANMGANSLMVSSGLLGFLNTQSTHYDRNGNAITTNDRPFKFGSGISELFALGAKLDLLKQNGAAHILSEPSVLCTNNKPALIQVGQTQSILTKAQQSTRGQGNIVNSYSREDIGITLKVKPRVSSHNKVSLSVEAEIEDVIPGSSNSADRPTTTKRKVVTDAIVNNGETIILGGLIKGSGGKGVVKVPILGDIPIIGELFKSTQEMSSKVNVVIYLTPYIVKDSKELTKLRKALVELEDIQNRYNALVRKGLEKQKKIMNAYKEATGQDVIYDEE